MCMRVHICTNTLIQHNITVIRLLYTVHQTNRLKICAQFSLMDFNFLPMRLHFHCLPYYQLVQDSLFYSIR